MTTMTSNVMESNSKLIWQSKTFWLNAVTIVLAVLTITEPDMLGLDPKMLLWITGVLNIMVRFLTNGSVSLTGSRSSAA